MRRFLLVYFCSFLTLVLNQLVVTNSDAATQALFRRNLMENDEFIRIQSVASGKFLTPKGEASGLTSSYEGILEGVSVLPATYLSESLQSWRISQTMGFPYRDGQFSPAYRIIPLSTVLKNQFSQLPWTVRYSDNGKQVQFLRPYKEDKCLTENHRSEKVTVDLCDEPSKNSWWRLLTSST